MIASAPQKAMIASAPQKTAMKKKVLEMNIKVFVRIRPLSTAEVKAHDEMAAIFDELRSEITFAGAKPWTFDRVFGPSMQQGQFYADVAEDVVKSCLDGFNGTVFAYGQTGAGKSWSMEGSKEEPGIQARAMRHLFDAVEDITKMHPEQTCLIRVSYLEIYNDMVHDLLGLAEGSPGGPHHDDHQRRRTTKHHGEDGSADARRPTSGSRKASSSSATADKAGSAPTKRIREDVKSHSFIVPDLTEVVVHSWEEVQACLIEGNSRRAVGATNMNAVSSRSHAIFQAYIERDYGVVALKNPAAGGDGAAAATAKAAAATKGAAGAAPKKKPSAITTAKLNLVDLAGSERGAKTGAGAGSTRAKEGSHINKSLSALGDVITALEKKALKGNPKEHVPYRNSALTKLLADSLGGNSRTVMVAAVGPAGSNVEESISTLRFAARVKAVKNKPKVNEDAKDTRLRELGEEIERLKHEQDVAAAAALESRKRDTTNMVESIKGKLLYKVALKRLEKKEREAEDDRRALVLTKDREIELLKEEQTDALARADLARAQAASKEQQSRAALAEAERRHQERMEAVEADKKALAKIGAKASAKAIAAEVAQADAHEKMARAVEEAEAAKARAAKSESAAASAEGRAQQAADALKEAKEKEAQRAAAAAADAVAVAADKEARERKSAEQIAAAQAALDEATSEAAAAASKAAAEALAATTEADARLRAAQESAAAEKKRADDSAAKLAEVRTMSKMMAQKAAEEQAKSSAEAVAAAAEREAAERSRAEESAAAAAALEDAQSDAAAAAAKAAAEAQAEASEAEARVRAEATRADANAARAAAAETQVQELRDEARAIAAAAAAEKQRLADDAAAKVAAMAAAGASAHDEEAQRTSMAEALAAKEAARTAEAEKEIEELKAALAAAATSKEAEAVEKKAAEAAAVQATAAAVAKAADTMAAAEAEAGKLKDKVASLEAEKAKGLSEMSASLSSSRAAEAEAAQRAVAAEAALVQAKEELEEALAAKKTEAEAEAAKQKLSQTEIAEAAAAAAASAKEREAAANKEIEKLKVKVETATAAASVEAQSLMASLECSRKEEAVAAGRAVAAEQECDSLRATAAADAEKAQAERRLLSEEVAALSKTAAETNQRAATAERRALESEQAAAAAREQTQTEAEVSAAALRRAEEVADATKVRLASADEQIVALKLEAEAAAEEAKRRAAEAEAEAAKASAAAASTEAESAAKEQIKVLEAQFLKREAALVAKVKATEEFASSIETDLDSKADECDQLNAAREDDVRKFNEMKGRADESLSVAQQRIDALTRDLQAAWANQGILEQKTRTTSGLMRLSTLVDRYAGRLLRRYLLQWAAANVSGYAPRSFPEQLGPFGFERTSLTDKISLNLQPGSGIFTYQVPLDDGGPLSELSRRFGDLIIDVGQLSPPHEITLSAQSRRFAGIPPEATSVIWAYPLVGMSEVASQYQMELDDPALLFVTFGGFVHTDGSGKVVATAAIASDGEDLYFEPPEPWRNEFTPLLHRQGRFQAITLKPLAEEGAKYYAWIHAGEELVDPFSSVYASQQQAVRSNNRRGSQFPGSSRRTSVLGAVGQTAGQTAWKVSQHGCFVYLFNEPDAEVSDPRNCVFPVWGGAGDGIDGDDAPTDLRANFQRNLDRRSIHAFLESDEEDEDSEESGDENDDDSSGGGGHDDRLTLAKSNAVANSMTHIPEAADIRQSLHTRKKSPPRHTRIRSATMSGVSGGGGGGGSSPPRMRFQATGTAMPPPVQPPRPPPVVPVDALSGRFEKEVQQIAFDDGPLGFGLTKKGNDLWPLIVGKISDQGQAILQGLVVGSAIVGQSDLSSMTIHILVNSSPYSASFVNDFAPQPTINNNIACSSELNGGPVRATTKGGEFVQQLSRLERPFLIGFRKPLPVEGPETTQSTTRGEGSSEGGAADGGDDGTSGDDESSRTIRKGVSFQRQKHRESAVGTKFRL